MKNLLPVLLFLIAAPSGSACIVKSIKLVEDAFEVTAQKYIPNKVVPSKAILIIPPTGGVNFIDKSYAKGLCKAGLLAVVLSDWTEADEYSLQLEVHRRFYQRAQRAIGLVIESVSDLEIGVLGTSVGGIHVSITTSLNPRIRSGFLIVGAGNIAGIIAKSTQEVLSEAKVRRIEAFGFKNESAYKLALEKILPYEPLKMPVDHTKKLGMIISTNDSVVPTAFQISLKEHWRPQYFFEYWSGHTGTVFWSWLLSYYDIIEFFKSS